MNESLKLYFGLGRPWDLFMVGPDENAAHHADAWREFPQTYRIGEAQGSKFLSISQLTETSAGRHCQPWSGVERKGNQH